MTPTEANGCELDAVVPFEWSQMLFIDVLETSDASRGVTCSQTSPCWSGTHPYCASRPTNNQL